MKKLRQNFLLIKPLVFIVPGRLPVHRRLACFTLLFQLPFTVTFKHHAFFCSPPRRRLEPQAASTENRRPTGCHTLCHEGCRPQQYSERKLHLVFLSETPFPSCLNSDLPGACRLLPFYLERRKTIKSISMIPCYSIDWTVTLMNVSIPLLNHTVKSAVTVTHDLDECLSSSHDGKKIYSKFILFLYARLSASAQNRNR